MNQLPFVYITFYPLVFWLASLIVGGGVGWVAALLLRLLFKSWSAGRNISMILPWRAAVFALLWLLWSPFFRFAFRIRELPGAVYDFMSIGISLTLLTFILTLAALVRHWFPATLAVRLVSGARSLAVAAVMVTTIGIAASATPNFMYVMRAHVVKTFDASIIWQGWLFVFLAMLAFDLLPGILQTVLAIAAGRKKSA